MKILGIHEGPVSSACIMIDGSVKSASSEERHTRIKNDMGYPKNAIEYCLTSNNIKSNKLDAVAVATDNLGAVGVLIKRVTNFKQKHYLMENYEHWKPVLLDGIKKDYMQFVDNHPELRCDGELPYDFSDMESKDFNFKEERIKVIQNHLKVKSDKIYFVDHHTAHACYGYFASRQRDKSLVITADGWGDGSNASIWLGDKDKLKLVKKIDKNQIANLYCWATLLLGMKPNDHEYKVMGLAPYSKDRDSKKPCDVYCDALKVDGDDFIWNEKYKDMFFTFKEKLDDCRFDGIAGGLQRFAELRVTEWIGNIIRDNDNHVICFSGGLALNVKINKRIMEMEEVKDLSVPASGRDESLSIGSAYYVAEKFGEQLQPLEHVYLGPAFDNKYYLHILDNLKHRYAVKHNVTNGEIASLLVDGEIVARCVGHMEFGARALGNRSILAHPSDFETVYVINEMIKFRDFWMPFTPSILKERSDLYVVNPKGVDCPFMTIAFDSTPLARKQLKAVIHPYDKTVRPQFVDKAVNPEYHCLISEFEKITGIPVLLNTSFNLHGHPIVCSPMDALDVFEKSGLKYLLLNDVLIRKLKENG